MKPLSIRSADPSLSLLLLLAAVSGLAPVVAAQCFHIDGSPVTDPGVAPCVGSSSAPAASMCCNLNRQPSRIKERQESGGSNADGGTNNALGLGSPLSSGQLLFTGPDVCLANGLCQLQVADAQGRAQVQFSRDSCTQPDWAGGCLKSVCPAVSGDSAPMTPCAATNQTTQWCCGSGSTAAACCALWPNHPDAALVPLSFAASSSGAAASEPPKGGPLSPANPVSFSLGPGGIVTLVTITTGAGPGPTSPSSGFSSVGGALPATNSASTSTSTPSRAAVSGQTASSGSVVSATALGSNNADSSDNGESVLSGTAGLTTQEVAGIVAGVVVVVVVLVSIGCFTAESMYKKRQQRYRARRMETMNQTYPLGPKFKPLM